MKIDSPTFLTETTFISASVQFSSGSQSSVIHQTDMGNKISGSSTSTGSFGEWYNK